MKVLARLSLQNKVEGSSVKASGGELYVRDTKNLDSCNFGIRTRRPSYGNKDCVECYFTVSLGGTGRSAFKRKLPDDILKKIQEIGDDAPRVYREVTGDYEEQVNKELASDFQKLVDQFDKAIGELFKKHGFK